VTSTELLIPFSVELSDGSLQRCYFHISNCEYFSTSTMLKYLYVCMCKAYYCLPQPAKFSVALFVCELCVFDDFLFVDQCNNVT